MAVAQGDSIRQGTKGENMKLKDMWKEFTLRLRLAGQVPTRLWFGDITPVGRLYAVKIDSEGNLHDIGLISTKLVTTAGVAWLATLLAGTSSGSVKYHDSGTGTTAESASDTGLVTPSGVARATGSQVASTNTYTSVGTQTYSSTLAITEHGIFTATTSVTLIDRSVFSAINVVSGDSIQFTYVLTLPSGG
jgi:hypothetical protein